MARTKDFDLARELAKPSFTPSVRDAEALVELIVAGHDQAPAVLAKLGDALGRVGGDAAVMRWRALDPAGDAELARRRDRALLIAGRDALREASSQVAVDVAPPAPVTVRLHTKPGLGELLGEELVARG